MKDTQEIYENIIDELKGLRFVRTPEEAEEFIDKLDELSRIPLDSLEDKAYCMFRLFEIPNEDSVNDAIDGILWAVEKFRKFLTKEEYIQVYFKGFEISHDYAFSWLSDLFTRLYYNRPDLQQEFEFQLRIVNKELRKKLISFYVKIEELGFEVVYSNKMISILNEN
jgi:5'-deoxynucleotidase YfbR-like HD superfamily hydrolase